MSLSGKDRSAPVQYLWTGITLEVQYRVFDRAVEVPAAFRSKVAMRA